MRSRGRRRQLPRRQANCNPDSLPDEQTNPRQQRHHGHEKTELPEVHAKQTHQPDEDQIDRQQQHTEVLLHDETYGTASAHGNRKAPVANRGGPGGKRDLEPVPDDDRRLTAVTNLAS